MSTLAPPQGTPVAADDSAYISRVPYLPGLDGMRALAVIAVMVYHANSDWLPGWLSRRRGVLRDLGLPDHAAADLRTRAHVPDLAAQVLDTTGATPAPGAVHDDDDRGRVDGGVQGQGPRSTARRRGRRAALRVELLPDLGRAGVHRCWRLRAAAPPVEPRRRGAVLPVLAGRDDGAARDGPGRAGWPTSAAGCSSQPSRSR